MRALCYHGKERVQVDEVPEPTICNPQDVVVRITATAICGSDLHIYDGLIPEMEHGDVLGHEFMGEVVVAGPAVTRLKVGDRVVVPFTISCGRCEYCARELWSLCDNSNPNAVKNAKVNGASGAGLFGYSHLYGGYAGGQAQFVRVPYADYGPIPIPPELPDEKVLFLSDVFPTGFMAAENCQITPGDVVAVWGCGPVGQFAIRSAFLLGAAKVIAIEPEPGRRRLAADAGALTISSENGVLEQLMDLTGGRGPDACIDAVGMEAHGSTYDNIKQALKLETDRPHVLRQALQACRKGGTVSVPGVYAGFLDKVPFGPAFAKGLTIRMGQTHVQRYLPRLLQWIQEGRIDPDFLITHRFPLSQAPKAYKMFRDQRSECIKVVLNPNA